MAWYSDFLSNLVDFGAGFMQMWGANDQARDLRSWWSTNFDHVSKDQVMDKIRKLVQASNMDVQKKSELLQKAKDQLADIANQRSFSADKATDIHKAKESVKEAEEQYAKSLAKADLANQASNLGTNALNTGSYRRTAEQIDDITKTFEKEI